MSQEFMYLFHWVGGNAVFMFDPKHVGVRTD